MMHPTKGVQLKFDSAEFEDFIYLIGVLNMAVKKAENMWEQSQLMAIQQQAAVQAQMAGKRLHV